MRPGSRRTWAAAIALLSAAAPSAIESAPARRPARASSPASGADLSFGYSYLRAGEASLNGWQLSGSVPARPSVRLVADLSGHYGSFAGASLLLHSGGGWDGDPRLSLGAAYHFGH